MYSKTVLFAAIVLACEAVQVPVVIGRADHDPHLRHREMAARQHEAQFLQFVALTRTCLSEVFPKTGLPEPEQKILLDMIRPINDLEREQRIREQKKETPEDGEKERAAKPPMRPVYTPPPPPFKCEQGEVVHLTPAEIYVRAMVKILDRTDLISERQKAQESIREALPCMDKMFKKDLPTGEQPPVPEKPAETAPVPAG